MASYELDAARGKRILVTGATDGIGLATAQALARGGARLLVHGRNPAKVESLAHSLGAVGLVADFAELAQVRRLAQEVAAQGPLDVLINNAGIFAGERVESHDGYELTFAVNHLAPFLLTLNLLDQMVPGGRCVHVSSIAHTRGRMRWDDLDLRTHYDGQASYSMSKLANVLFSNALARRVAARGLTSNALHPGVITTKLLKAGFNITGASVEAGAQTSLTVALSHELEGVTGRYFRDCREVPAAPQALDEAAQERLWTESLRRVGRSEAT